MKHILLRALRSWWLKFLTIVAILQGVVSLFCAVLVFATWDLASLDNFAFWTTFRGTAIFSFLLTTVTTFADLMDGRHDR